MSLPNYYAVLDVPQDASEDDLKKAIRRGRNLWASRANHPDPDVRSEAEKNVQLFTEAEQTLLDATRRAAYDDQLLRQPPPVPDPNMGDGEQDWLLVARNWANQAMWSQAHHAATLATQATPKRAEAWREKGRYAQHLGNDTDAEYAFNQGMMLAPTDPFYALCLVDFYLERDRQTEAERCLKFATSQPTSDNAFVYVWFCEASRRLQLIDDAVKYGHRALELDPSNPAGRDELAVALLCRLNNDFEKLENFPQQYWFSEAAKNLDYIRELKAEGELYKSIYQGTTFLLTERIVELAQVGWMGREDVGWHISSLEQLQRAKDAVEGLKLLNLEQSQQRIWELEKEITYSQITSTHDAGALVLALIFNGVTGTLTVVVLILFTVWFGDFRAALVAYLILMAIILGIAASTTHMANWQWHAKGNI
ncbi:DnaJ domain-containing protein [Micrococcales bacterium KH10]|nr:DnaJ domain-containing protein [Micrococcales bacterium KH10]